MTSPLRHWAVNVKPIIVEASTIEQAEDAFEAIRVRRDFSNYVEVAWISAVPLTSVVPLTIQTIQQKKESK